MVAIYTRYVYIFSQVWHLNCLDLMQSKVEKYQFYKLDYYLASQN